MSGAQYPFSPLFYVNRAGYSWVGGHNWFFKDVKAWPLNVICIKSENSYTFAKFYLKTLKRGSRLKLEYLDSFL